ncbi:hypothetical protein J5J86_11390 [Aquabacter sp. L1I39]|uniref:hypothetical protein n=1 Tax=Aquabacter sp. L1I39 TaxID=2820278 RepID=UPI001ADC3CEE|nr:hypothetical protein [Aquabacter sp. L1I39]QTL05841.1 hypothetical protein J5J86_11390 [Aquabacter sp. L1I39]
MTENLFFLGPDNAPRVMMPSGFLSEAEFQGLLERYPELLTDSDFGEGSPRRWVLVKREAGIADREDGGGRWSLDHLFLDQAGVPTLLEVKRATDTRARREVVAQMLDYAANSVSWWSIEDIRNWFIETSLKRNEDANARLAALLDTSGVDEERFWRQVEANLRSGRIRMLFVADEIAPELQRIVEFLNEQMNPATVAALELRLFSDGVGRILSPRIFGATQRALQNKATVKVSPAESVSEWLSALDVENRQKAEMFIAVSAETGGRPAIAKKSLAIEVSCDRRDGTHGPVRPIYVRQNGRFSVAYGMMGHSRALENPAVRADLVQELATQGFATRSVNPPESDTGYPIPSPSDAEGWSRVRTILTIIKDRLETSENGSNS